MSFKRIFGARKERAKDENFPVPQRSETDPAIIFIHGLSGSPQKTWSVMANCFRADTATRHLQLDFYKYPTTLFRLPFSASPPGLRGIADGLSTFLDEAHGKRTSLYIVAHSLGGLIARQMIISQMKSRGHCRVTKLALIAVPNNGSMLANVGSDISFHHRQLKRLSRDDEALLTLNAEWEQLKIEEKIQVRYVVGGCDRVVPQESAVPYQSQAIKKSVLISEDHRSIICPDGINDLRFMVIRRFILDKIQQSANVTEAETKKNLIIRKPDPLFDVYTEVDSVFYVKRNIDVIIQEALGAGNVWVTGISGVGKTTVLRNVVFASGWSLKHVNLGGYKVDSARDLFEAMSREIASIAEFDQHLPFKSDIGTCSTFLKSALMRFPRDLVSAIVVEELPVPGHMLTDFINHIRILLESISIDERLQGRVVFAFSSLVEPPNVSAKAKEKIQMLRMGRWSNGEIVILTNILAETIRPSLSQEDRSIIVNAASGSPRFVKQLFRTWKSVDYSNFTLASIVQMTLGEMLQ